MAKAPPGEHGMTRVTRYSFYGLVSVALAVLGLHIYHQHQQAAREWRWNLPRTFPQPRVPADNPMTEAKFQLGRRLFFDKRLSGNGTMACGNCHQQRLAFTDGRPVAEGSTGDHTARGAQSIANVAYYPTLTWANPSQFSLETQAAVPMFVDNLAVELGINDGNMQVVLARFRDDPDYQAR
ncbi:MAG TPA: cytochrome-c peroxidase, partial [Acidimicrobiales bacterium]|nr:cytochrome-c peroxidase [Acidimicrobiales bacterium]